MKNFQNAIIEECNIGISDRGTLRASILLKFGDGSTHQGFGCDTLYLNKSFTHHKIESMAGHFIYRIMEVADVENWNDLVGKSLRFVHTDELNPRIKEIGHIIKDDWFSFDEFKDLNQSEE